MHTIASSLSRCALSIVLIIAAVLLSSLPSSCNGQAIYSFSGTFANQPSYIPPELDGTGCEVDQRDTLKKYVQFTYTFPTDGLRRLYITGSIFLILDELWVYANTTSFDPRNPCAGNPSIFYNDVTSSSTDEFQSIQYYPAGAYTFVMQSSFSYEPSPTSGIFAGVIYETEYKVFFDGSSWVPPRYGFSNNICEVGFGILTPLGTYTWTAPETQAVTVSGYASSRSYFYMTIYKGAWNESYTDHQCNDNLLTLVSNSYNAIVSIDNFKVVRGEVYTVVVTLNLPDMNQGVGISIQESGYRVMANVSHDVGFTEPTRYNGANTLGSVACLDNSTFNGRPYAAFVFTVVQDTWFFVDLDKSVSNEYAFFWYSGENAGSSSVSPLTCRSTSTGDVDKDFAFLGYSSYVGGPYYASRNVYTLIATPYRRIDADVASGSWGINVKYATGNLITQPYVPPAPTTTAGGSTGRGRTTSAAVASIVSSSFFVLMSLVFLVV